MEMEGARESNRALGGYVGSMMEKGSDFRSWVIELRDILPLPNAHVGAGAYVVGRRNANLSPRWDGGNFNACFTKKVLGLSTVVSMFLLLQGVLIRGRFPPCEPPFL